MSLIKQILNKPREHINKNTRGAKEREETTKHNIEKKWSPLKKVTNTNPGV